MGEYGECVVTRIDDPIEGMQLRIDRADPRILASPELLESLAAHRDVGIPATFDGQVLRICGTNRTVVYRVVGRTLNGDGWRDPCVILEWPD